MVVPVVDIRVVRVPMAQRLVHVPVRMGLAGGRRVLVDMLMVLVVHVPVGVRHRVVLVLV
jgi:hypothetical protein